MTTHDFVLMVAFSVALNEVITMFAPRPITYWRTLSIGVVAATLSILVAYAFINARTTLMKVPEGSAPGNSRPLDGGAGTC